jgi:hypothetical protein
MSAPKWAVGMRKIGPGLYVTKEGALHVDGAEICASLGCPPTAENLKIAEDAAVQAVRESWPDITIEHRDD